MNILHKAIKEFFNCWDEWHAFILGWEEVFTIGDVDVPIPPLMKMICEKEYWYYRAGISTAWITMSTIFIAMMVLIVWM